MVNQVSASIEQRQLQGHIAMLIALISWAMLFATLFMGYAALRLTSDTWPPMGMSRIPLTWPNISSLVILLSSFSFELFRRFSQARWLWITLFLGSFFVFSQFQVWNYMQATGLYADTGIFPSILYGFTWIHSAHIVAALILLLWLLWKCPRFTEGNFRQNLSVLNVGKFWHFLGIVWLLMYIFIFLL